MLPRNNFVEFFNKYCFCLIISSQLYRGITNLSIVIEIRILKQLPSIDHGVVWYSFFACTFLNTRKKVPKTVSTWYWSVMNLGDYVSQG